MTLPADAHIGSVSLAVAQLARSIAFYTDTLGFRVIAQTSTHAILGAGDRALVELHERAGAVPRPRRCAGLYHFAILVPSRAALGAALRRLADRHYALTGASDHLVSEALYLDDPDGLGIEIYRDRPRSEWRFDGAEVRMAVDPLDLQAVAAEPGAERPWDELDAGTAIGHVHLHVPHLDTAERLYCQDVGFSPSLRGLPSALFIAAGGYHHHVGLNTWAGVGAPPPPYNAVGMTRFTVAAAGLVARDVVDPSTGVTIACVPSQQRN